MAAKAIYTCLWFDGKAQQAAEFYCSVFPSSRILFANQTVVNWELNGQKFMGLNGGPRFTFSEAISLVVDCDTQEEIDHYWNHLTADGGQEGRCGWLKDKFGVSWQIIPTILPALLSDPGKAPRVMAAFMQMNKFDLQTLLEA
ncbi:VOC family protein [Neolewinella lacunae]|uniref:VOC family protein n=1 Tax=Neolewinella lacunae TaxID=1517758 RepID=A0A923TAB8_9BACT|nr:VOC family protein [Neolewinella lacunae]MBC6995998.1 VOC family protein [Neolewinella lacunae]MDN3633172.1 VOC family protein [Neolewinella lacunae]